ncbi:MULTISPECIES: 4-hydroxybenzoate octaprenyltransferase [unclassified Agarivorans]|uniref:4-hydroxybenzoate octaprenyltransferase n=1 Tax=unclassified Agarivorans TaxID=2636026 RepID=UPI0026E189F7|nr:MULTISPECIES: 4-hydroxybenzoate octaprenyltransferase [unclassified Agarivorans]MDO6687564.1 4-hydroxybenzoate octaprenyltransferase [Agarivorans sp. 3_MG-2023]MDO6717103.1 4-hydroxybenzoate octaprenyltransferase [Agarivorans sp. 2_MG-2023]
MVLQLASIRPYWQLMRADKPIGTLLLLWPALWALWLAAEGLPSLSVFVVFVLGVFFMRSAGCVINDYADRKVDAHVKRTAQRPLATGEVSERNALSLFAGLVAASFLLVLTQNTLTILLSFAALVLAAIYPFMKRYTHLPQLFLGLAFSWCIPMAYAAQTGSVPSEAWLLLMANVCWTIAYDTKYAMVDRDDDLLVGIKSTAILFGRFDKLIIALLQLSSLLCFAALAYLKDLSWAFDFALLAAAVLFVHQQKLIRYRDRDACFQAFLNNNYVGLAIFLGIASHYAWLAWFAG